ncbi:acyltransferase family protein [bacterium]|nr:acyltransferase family protein [bacterium]MBR3362404.1 acyltransferase family protein [Bacilli bacterium]
MDKNRLYFFDNLKFILITLVVIGHFLMFSSENEYAKGVFLFIYSFHMPLFVFVTGFFAKKVIHGDENKRLNKIIGFFIIYLIYKFIVFLMYNYIYNEEYDFYIFTEYEVPWYLLACVVWIIITYVFKNIKFKYLFIFSIICFLFIGYDNNIVDQLCLSRVIIFYPFYLLGYYMSEDQLNKLVIFLHNKKDIQYFQLYFY